MAVDISKLSERTIRNLERRLVMFQRLKELPEDATIEDVIAIDTKRLENQRPPLG
jgi:hypothetical protein